jgi:hypothetical protein
MQKTRRTELKDLKSAFCAICWLTLHNFTMHGTKKKRHTNTSQGLDPSVSNTSKVQLMDIIAVWLTYIVPVLQHCGMFCMLKVKGRLAGSINLLAPEFYI